MTNAPLPSASAAADGTAGTAAQAPQQEVAYGRVPGAGTTTGQSQAPTAYGRAPQAESYGWTPGRVRPHRQPAPSLEDPVAVVREPYVCRASAWAALYVVPCAILLLSFGGWLIANPGESLSGRASLVAGHGPVTVVAGVGSVLLGLVCLWALWLILFARVRASHEGITVSLGLGSLGAHQVPWPRSRSSLLVTRTGTRNGVTLTAYVLDPSTGRAVLLRGMQQQARRPDVALRRVLTHLDSLWAWGVSRGLTVDEGWYQQASSRSVEESRIQPELLDAERRRLLAGG